MTESIDQYLSGSERNGRRSIRERIAQAAEDNYEALESFFRQALNADKSVHTSCPHCGKRFRVDVPDWAARDKIVNTMLTQGFGRPAAETDAGAVVLTVIRRIVLPDGTEIEGGALAQPDRGAQ
jgi:hypothetical protein